ncbi:MAG: DUF4340 domain-containing protein [Candidatus Thiodiazotropha sp.]|jgi:hypothetical protein
MKRLILILSSLLVAQVVLAITINLADTGHGAFKPEEKLLAFDPESVDTLQISDGQTQILLRKQAGGWVLPENQDFPVDNLVIKPVLEQLSTMGKGWPVATSQEALKRFKVADDLYEYHLTFSNHDKEVAQLYIGTSPGFRKVHARPGDEERVFSIDFDSWRVSAKVDDWIDKKLLQLDKDKIANIDVSNIKLINENGHFKLADIKDNETLNQTQVDSFVDTLAGLQITSLFKPESNLNKLLEATKFEVKIKTKSGDDLLYKFSKPKDADYYVLQRSDKAYSYKVAEQTAKQLFDTKRKKLLSMAKSDQKTEPDAL